MMVSEFILLLLNVFINYQIVQKVNWYENYLLFN